MAEKIARSFREVVDSSVRSRRGQLDVEIEDTT